MRYEFKLGENIVREYYKFSIRQTIILIRAGIVTSCWAQERRRSNGSRTIGGSVNQPREGDCYAALRPRCNAKLCVFPRPRAADFGKADIWGSCCLTRARPVQVLPQLRAPPSPGEGCSYYGNQWGGDQAPVHLKGSCSVGEARNGIYSRWPRRTKLTQHRCLPAIGKSCSVW